MHLYEPPVNDFQFIIHKLLKVQNLKLKGYSDLSPDFTKPIFEEAGKLAREELAPLNISVKNVTKTPEASPAFPTALPILFPKDFAKPAAKGIISIANNANFQFW